MTAKHVVAWKWAKENKDAKKGLLLEFISSLTLSTATTGISSSTVFTSDLFCIPWTSCSFGPGKQDDWAICSSQNSSTYPHHCFSALQFWGRERERALCANLTLFPRKIHSWTLLSCLSHYGGESFSLQTWQAASSPNQTARPRARRIGGEIACICLLRI